MHFKRQLCKGGSRQGLNTLRVEFQRRARLPLFTGLPLRRFLETGSFRSGASRKPSGHDVLIKVLLRTIHCAQRSVEATTFCLPYYDETQALGRRVVEVSTFTKGEKMSEQAKKAGEQAQQAGEQAQENADQGQKNADQAQKNADQAQKNVDQATQ